MGISVGPFNVEFFATDFAAVVGAAAITTLTKFLDCVRDHHNIFNYLNVVALVRFGHWGSLGCHRGLVIRAAILVLPATHVFKG